MSDTASYACIGHKPFGVLAVPCRQCLCFKRIWEDAENLSFAPPFKDGKCPNRVAPEGETDYE